MKPEFPRLLVAAEFPPNAPGGGPAVVRQMLKDWPAEKLFWWSCLPESDGRFGQRVAAHEVAAIPARLYPHRRLTREKSWLLENFWTPWAAAHFQKTLSRLRPEVVWVIPHCWAIPPLARVLPPAKIGFHVTVQDYADVGNCVAAFGPARSQRLADMTARLYASATTRDATSHPMVADLFTRTGQPAAQMLHAGLEPQDFAYLESKSGPAGGEIRIAHAGTLQAEADFAGFVTALKRIRTQLPRGLRIDFFGAHSYRARAWFDPAWMQEHGNLPEAELSQALRCCTWGVSLLPLADSDPQYSRYSFPTKFITSLAAGLPVITLGHPESSVVRMAQAYRVGVCLTSGNSEVMERELLRVLSLADPWSEFGPEIRRCARTEFDAERMRRKLFECLRRGAAGRAAPAGAASETNILQR